MHSRTTKMVLLFTKDRVSLFLQSDVSVQIQSINKNINVRITRQGQDSMPDSALPIT